MDYSNWQTAHKVAVIGAGTMGSGIAAHLANLGFAVLLFDMTDQSVRDCFERAKRAKPPHFFDAESVGRVELCSIATDLSRITEADWVCEAIIEHLDAKRALYERIEPVLREDAMVSTNTSGLEIDLLGSGRQESFRKRFLGTHFFNPPRYLKLIELIPTTQTDSAAVAAITTFLEERVGRRVVVAKDTPGFIANRYGMWVLYQAMHTAEKLGFSPELTDAISGALLGRPSTAVYRLADLIGLDVMEDIASNLMSRCNHDLHAGVLQTPLQVQQLIGLGFLGNKSGQGFYKREGSDFFVFEKSTSSYRSRLEDSIPQMAELSKMPIGERLKEAFNLRGEIGEYVRLHLAPSLAYATAIGSEVSHSVQDFDSVMKWGWGWGYGPFELIDALGWETVAKFAVDFEQKVPPKYYDAGSHFSFDSNQFVSTQADARYMTVGDLPVVEEGDGWAVRSAHENGYVFEFRTKANALTPHLVEGLIAWMEKSPGERITIANDAKNFSVGYDLRFFLQAVEDKQFDEVDAVLMRLQQCCEAISKADSCSAIHGYALGGGFEIAAHSRSIVVRPETMIGLPEVLVGLIPAGGGTTLMRERTAADLHSFVNMAVNIATGRTLSQAEARNENYLRATDRLSINPDMSLHTALGAERPVAEATEWVSAHPAAGGMIDQRFQEMRKKGQLSTYGLELAEDVRRIFVKAKSREDSLAMERDTFLKRLTKPMTHERIKHMLETGKPLAT